MNQVIVLYGPPGAGKTTAARKVLVNQEATYLSISGIVNHIKKFKLAGYELVSECVSKGELVPSEIIDQYVLAGIMESEIPIILDGYPRSSEQLRTLVRSIADIRLQVVNFVVDYETIAKRITNRLQCTVCDVIYNKGFSEEVKCRICNSELTRRDDDDLQVIKRRYDDHLLRNQRLIQLFQENAKFNSIDATGTIDDVFHAAFLVIGGFINEYR